MVCESTLTNTISVHFQRNMQNNKMFIGMSHLETEQADADPSNQQQVLFPPQHYFVQAAVDINALLD